MMLCCSKMSEVSDLAKYINGEYAIKLQTG